MAHTCNDVTSVKCLKPVKIINPHYLKLCNGDKRQAYENYRMKVDYKITVGCGKCFLCKKSYQSKWRLRLNHEYMYGAHDLKNSYFVTLTLNEDYYQKALYHSSQLIREFLEAYRYQVKKRTGKGKSVFHWIVSERGEKRGRLHFHGILFDCVLPKYIIEQCWKYGFVSFKQLTLKRCGYVTKYITKGNSPSACKESVEHQPRVWCSAGIGKCYVELPTVRSLHVTPYGLVPFIVKNNFVYGMPRYYKQKIFSDEERELLKLQYYAENTSDFALPKPPFSINGWLTSSPERLLSELQSLSIYLPKKTIVEDSLLTMREYSIEQLNFLLNEFNK